MTHERTPQEMIADALTRYSVADLREMSDDDLMRGERVLDRKEKRPEILASGEQNLIKWWKIRSVSGNEYEVRRFENFVFCSCLDFFFSKTCCRHIVVTTKHFRRREHKEMDRAPRLLKSEPRKGTRIGGVLIN